MIESYLCSIEPACQQIEEVLRRCRYSGNKFKILKPASEREIQDNMNLLRNKFS